MRALFFGLFLALLISGCESTNWNRPGVKYDQKLVRADKADCRKIAFKDEGVSPLQRFSRDDHYLTKCTKNGDEVTCTTRAAMRWGGNPRAASEAIARAINGVWQRERFSSCMLERGNVKAVTK